MYVMAKSFVNAGLNVSIHRDEQDHFPFSQPVWEDCSLTLEHHELSRTYTLAHWRNIERRLGWIQPDFFVDQGARVETSSRTVSSRRIIGQSEPEKSFESRLLSYFRSVDVAIVCGVRVEILALMSGTPYVILPHGGDIRLASHFDFPLSLNRQILGRYATHQLLRKSFRRAGAIITHSPTAGGGHVTEVPFDTHYAPLPLMMRKNQSFSGPKSNRFSELFARLGVELPAHKRFVFIPSRADFFWKGTDLLLESIRQTKPKNLHFVFAGWGNDFQSARGMLPTSMATFLPFALSKPLLFEAFGSAELVIDQFRMGSYGTSALEAISANVPVMMYINTEVYVSKGWEPPPLINTRDVRDISHYLRLLDNEELDVAGLAQIASNWFERTHEGPTAVARVVKILEKVLKNR